MKIREGTYDDYILKEINRTYGWLNVTDRTVLDIGACFGAAAVFFADKGAKEVISYEPEPDNFALLSINTKEYASISLVNAAVSSENGELSFFVNENGINKGTHTIRPTRGRKEVKVEAVSFKEQLDKFKPEVLKIDCEGGEYVFLTEALPDYVKEVCLEIHRTNPEYREKAFDLVKLFSDWECVKQPKLEGGHWATIGGWRRP
jgi:FkbM family methyltransferase